MIHAIEKQKGEWIVRFREGGNALVFHEDDYYEGPVNADGSVVFNEDEFIEADPTEPEVFAAIIVHTIVSPMVDSVEGLV